MRGNYWHQLYLPSCRKHQLSTVDSKIFHCYWTFQPIIFEVRHKMVCFYRGNWTPHRHTVNLLVVLVIKYICINKTIKKTSRLFILPQHSILAFTLFSFDNYLIFILYYPWWRKKRRSKLVPFLSISDLLKLWEFQWCTFFLSGGIESQDFNLHFFIWFQLVL